MMTPEPSTYSRWRPHPWHGLKPGPDPPRIVYAYIEITTFDTIKYEVDKDTGYLRVDRPQITSSHPPTLYGFVPRTYCSRRVGALSGEGITGDGDPLDICVISERPVAKSEVILNARVVGGLRTLDSGEADDKIIAVLENDAVWGEVEDLSGLPPALIDRLRHYFATYKLKPGEPQRVKIEQTYGREQAFQVVEAALADYNETFADSNRPPATSE